MSVLNDVEETLAQAVDRAFAGDAPPGLARAVRHAVFSGGARVRPRLCLAVAGACGAPGSPLAKAAGAALEMIHCASLVHDDLPCFDDADMRRGRASVHTAFGEPAAVLAGDALIVLAFETVARETPAAPNRAGAVVQLIAQAVGAPGGIIAGQAWELETGVDLSRYQRAKTGALFIAAAAAGAVAAGSEPGPWRRVGDALGEAYQVADDLRDVLCDAAELGKPAGQDEAHGRPNAALKLGVDGAVARLEGLIMDTVAAIPPCDGDQALKDLIMAEAVRLAPRGRSRFAA